MVCKFIMSDASKYVVNILVVECNVSVKWSLSKNFRSTMYILPAFSIEHTGNVCMT